VSAGTVVGCGPFVDLAKEMTRRRHVGAGRSTRPHAAQVCEGGRRLEGHANRVSPTDERAARCVQSAARTRALNKPLAGRNERRVEWILTEALRQAIDLERIPRTTLTVAVQVCGEDGGLTAAAINAAVLAVVDAKVPMRGALHACQVSLTKEGDWLVDPTAAEALRAAATITGAFLRKDSGLVPVALSDSSTGCACVLDASGAMTSGAMREGASLCEGASAAVGAFVSLAVKKLVKKSVEMRGEELE
jgi:hypothetical protein